MTEHQLNSSADESSIVEMDTMTSLAQGAVADELLKPAVLDHLSSFGPQVPYSAKHSYLLSSFVRLVNLVEPSLSKAQVEEKCERVKAYALSLLLIGPKVTSDAQIRLLTQEAVRNRFIHRAVLNQLSSFHPQVPTPMKYRYLLACFCTKLKVLLNNHSISYEAKLFSYNINIPPVVCDPEDTPLGPDQLPCLIEMLVPYAYKWRDIGSLLKFHAQDLDNIAASPLLIPCAPQSYLTRLLEDWLLQNMKHVRLPTVGNLKRALNSETVGLGTVASTFTDSIASSLPFNTGVDMPYSAMKISLKMGAAPEEEHEFTCVGTNYVKLEEDELTLLEVQLEMSNFERGGFQYRWLVDDTPIVSDGGICLSGFSSPSLCIKADIDTDDCKFSCQVTVPTLESPLRTNPVVLNISCSLDEYRAGLASMYLAQPEVPEDKWPPVNNKKHINLALIKQQGINYNSDYTRLTIRGDVDDILQHKEIIEYGEVYKSFKSGQLILVEGRPGSGKTTFIHKVAHDWADSSNGAICLMLLVSLRVLNSYANPNLSDILKLFQELKVSEDLIEKRGGKGVCFVFDGLDEFSPIDGENSIVFKLIDKKYLPHSTVVVASRPAAIAQFRNRANRIVEVLGFLSNQILEYFDYYPFSHNTKPEELKAYLSTHPNVFHMCYLPIHAAMIAFLFDHTGEVPKTETEIYKHFTRFTLIRSLSKNKEIGIIADLKDANSLCGDELDCYKQICHLAFQKTVNNKQVLDEDEVWPYFQTKEDIDISLGLITIDRTAGLYGNKNIYTFLHLTFQEFLAANHFCTLSTEEQSKLIQELADKNHMLVVWKFYCGLVTFKPYENLFKSILCKIEGNQLYQIQCAYESQQQIVCVQYLKTVHRHIEIADKYLSVPDFTAMGYVADMMSLLPIELTLLNCNFGIEEVDAFLSQMQVESKQLFQVLHIEVETVDATMMECMKRLLTNLGSLNSLSLKAKTKTELTDISPVVGERLVGLTKLSLVNMDIRPLQPLIDLCALKDLQVLSLEGSSIEGYTTFYSQLEYCSNLKELNICSVNVSEEGAEALSNSLQACRSLEKIFMARTKYTGAILRSLKEHRMKIKAEDIELSATDLFFQLKHLTKLKSLDVCFESNADSHSFNRYCANWSELEELRIRRTDIRDSATTSVIFNCLSHFKELTTFALDNTIASFKDVKSLMASLQHCPNLQVLDLSNNLAGPAETATLASHLMDFNSLKGLLLDNNRIGDDGAKAISSHFQHYHKLEELRLARNGIGSDGGMELAANLHHCTLLQTLDLQGNNIGDEAVHAVASTLQCCTNFKTLYLSRDTCDSFVQTYSNKMSAKERIFKFEVIFCSTPFEEITSIITTP